MIFLGLDDAAKEAKIARVAAAHDVRKVVVFSPEKFQRALALSVPHEHVEWAEIQMYRTFYRLMQEVDGGTLVVVNECLRTQNRHDLTYNCIRNVLLQAGHRLVFQYLPLIDTWADFAALFDFETGSRWKREKVGVELLREARVHVAPVAVELYPILVPVGERTRDAYAKEKAALIAEVRGDPGKDPHLVPRNLALVGGKAKLAKVEPARAYLGRNNRFKLPNLATYKEAAYPSAPYVVFELPHAFGDLVDVIALTGQRSLDVLVADLPVDRWYLDRTLAWAARLQEAYALLAGAVDGAEHLP